MVQSQYSLSWDSYNSTICKGFSALQQNGEFVDMTLAADGHYVKVHQVLMALASPYLKELIASAPCQHPVVFLNNVSHRTLSLLLVYIYSGEVHVPADNLSKFAEAAKNLHIKGLENIVNNQGMTIKVTENMSQMEEGEFCHVSGIRRMAVPMNEGTEEIKVPAAARNIYIRRDAPTSNSSVLRNSRQSSLPQVSTESRDDSMIDADVIDDNTLDSDDDFKHDDSFQKANEGTTSHTNEPSTNLQFTVSIRGSLQIILNRYIYNLHSSTHRAGVRRWRCVDYRNHKCTAFVVTKGNVVLNRANLHNHPFHDKKILAKIEKKSVYSALDEVFGYKEKEDAKLRDNDASANEEYTMHIDYEGVNVKDEKLLQFKNKIN